MFKAVFNELYLELNSILKYDEFKVYYIVATAIIGFVILRWEPRLEIGVDNSIWKNDFW